MSPRRPEGPPALALVDKPAGPTSFTVVRRVRRALGYRRVGHGGTLDPFATGLLVLGLGGATRLLGELQGGDKEYLATVRFGQATDSLDCTGTVVAEGEAGFDEAALVAALDRFTGEIEQRPPALSAIKVDGERSYARVHRGDEPVEPPTRTVRIDRLELRRFDGRDAELTVACGGGTYIRSLARDLGEALGCPAHLAALRRTRVGVFSLDEARPLEQLCEEGRGGPGVLDPAAIGRGWPAIPLDEDEAWEVRHGRQPAAGWEERAGCDDTPDRALLVDGAGRLVASCRREGSRLALAVVLPAAPAPGD